MDSIILIIVCLLFLFMGFSLGWHAREKAAERIVNKLMDQLEQSKEELDTSVIKISIEKHNNTYYVYDKENNSFMGQASNRKELEDVLGERFPGKRFLAESDNLKEVGFK